MKSDYMKMNSREIFSILLLCLGLILALLPLSGNRSFSVKPHTLLTGILDDKTFFTVDQIARFVVSEDSTVQLIDLRSPDEFRKINIPGSINVPYSELVNSDPGSFISSDNKRYIFYSNGEMVSNYALTIAKGMNHLNTYVMKGGLNEWFDIVMNSSFSGDRITARENALFGIRMKARTMFNELNSLPDSLKMKFLEAKHTAARKLDGGCE